MTQKERHFEFMKAAMTGSTAIVGKSEIVAHNALQDADAALAEFNKRWPEGKEYEHLS